MRAPDRPAEWGGRDFHILQALSAVCVGVVGPTQKHCRTAGTDLTAVDSTPLIGRSQPVVRPPPHSAGQMCRMRGHIEKRGPAYTKFASSPCGAARSNRDLTRHTDRQWRAPSDPASRANPPIRSPSPPARIRNKPDVGRLLTQVRHLRFMSLRAHCTRPQHEGLPRFWSSGAGKHWTLTARRSRWAGGAGCDGRV